MENHVIGTPYDDVFRTLLNDCTSLIIPVINEMFGENYTGEEAIRFLPNEHFITQPGADTKEKITDSCYQVSSEKVWETFSAGFEIQSKVQKKKYHLECQSGRDNSMVLRMFEYDSQIALDDSEVVEGKLVVTFPHSGVLYLRHTKNTPDAMTVQINTPSASVTYQIPVIKIQTYTIDEIFDKGLLFLIPFHIFCYEKQFEEYETNEHKLKQLQAEYQKIRDRLEELTLNGTINEYIKCTLLDMSKKVLDSIAAKYANVRKEVASVMGGKVLEYEAKTILQKGRREGEEIGRREGEAIGQRKGKIDIVLELLRDGLLSITEAAKRLDMQEEELKKYL
jgi:hypothetical protein